MYFNIDIQITIGQRITFSAVKSITINKSLHKLSDTATIVLPRAFKEDLKGKPLLEYIKIGDTIKIELGYNGVLETEFTGYIIDIGAEIPTVIECEDEMYNLKRTKKFNHTFSSTTLKNILNLIAPNYQVECLDINFGKFMIENATAFEVLEGLKKFGIRCSFKNKKIHASTLVEFKADNTHQFEFGKNIRRSSELKYKTKQNKECKVKAISIQKGTSKKVIYEFGEPINGERTLHAPLNLNKSELKKWTESYYNSIVFQGYEGVLHSWGIPRTNPSDTLELKDNNYPDGHRNGKFLIEDVKITVNETDGIKRANKISIRI